MKHQFTSLAREMLLVCVVELMHALIAACNETWISIMYVLFITSIKHALFCMGPSLVCVYTIQVCLMEVMGILFYLFSLLTVVESSSRLGTVLLVKTGNELKMCHSWPMLSAGIFVLVALVLSIFLIIEHLAVYSQPEEQKFLIGLILMVPVYALESFLSLVDSDAAFNCQVMRDCYEAFALYCFERYLIACLGGEETRVKLMECENQVTSSMPLLEAAYAGVVKHPFPLNCLVRQWYLGADFYQAVKIGIVQYMILKMICPSLAIILERFGVYGEGQFEWTYGYLYLAVILNFSQTWALYCLIRFYSVTKEMLEPIKPLSKFLVVKSIVFLTWWQGVVIAFLFSMGVLRSSLAQELATRIQDYIICIEMGIAAVVHIFVFPARPYQQGERCVRNVAVMSDYASLGAPPDPEEVRESERSTRVLAQPDERNMQLSFPENVQDVVLESGEIILDDVKFTVTHVVEPMERGIAELNKTFHQISENMRQIEKWKRSSKDANYLIPMRSWSKEFPQDTDNSQEGSTSDSGLAGGKGPLSTPRHPHQL